MATSERKIKNKPVKKSPEQSELERQKDYELWGKRNMNPQQRVGAFYQQLRSIMYSNLGKLAKNRRVRELCVQEKQQLTGLYPKINTQHRYFTIYRKHVREWLTQDGFSEGKDQILKIFLDTVKLNDEEMNKRTDKSETALHVRMKNNARFDAEKFIRIGLQCLASEDHYTVVIGLMALTGRRSIEILKTAQFEPVNDNEYGLLFKGQAKTRGSANSQDNYLIPCLAPSHFIIASLAHARAFLRLDSLTNEEINHRYNDRLTSRVGRFAACVNKEGAPHLNCRALRSMYAMSAYETLGAMAGESFNAYAAEILGHSKNDKDTANSYSIFGITRAPTYKLR